MVTKPKILGIVPARGGSKSIPRKNIKLLDKHPLIAYSIAAGLQSKHINRVIVSTDDEEIAQIGKSYGAEVPFMRPPELAEDMAHDLPVFKHALQWFEEHENYSPDIIIQIRPTTPFRPKTCIDEAIELLLNDPLADSVRGVTRSGQNPYKMWRIHEGVLSPLLESEFSEPYNMLRQELPQTYWQTGHVEVIRRETILKKNSMTGDRILSLVIEPKYAVDLDTLEQWAFANFIIKQGNLDIASPEGNAMTALSRIRLLVLDFDGVMTDDRVYVTQDGTESVACSRSDGMGLSLLRQLNIPVVVLSTETNPVVSARCKKLNIGCYQGIAKKDDALKQITLDYNIELKDVAFVGNDVNDLEALRSAGLAIAVADAHPKILSEVDLILTKNGGYGAIRELCDQIIIEKMGELK